MPRGFAFSRRFRGESDLRPTLQRNNRELETHINSYIPSYEEDDGVTLILRGDLTTGGDISIPTGATVDGVDPSSHNHDGTGNNGMVIDHGELIGKGDDDHSQYLNDTRHSATHQGTRVGRTTDYTVDSMDWQPIPWNDEYEDDGNWHNNATNPDRITVDADGWYLLTWAAFWDDETTEKKMKFTINGGNYKRRDFTEDLVSFTVPAFLSNGDYVRAEAIVTSGTVILQSNTVNTWFSVVRLG